MENSFSLQFNKMTQLKTVQDYESEIARLQNENWEIKHQLAYLKSNSAASVDEDIQKLLYDSKTSIDILESENKNFQKQIEHMKEIIRSNNVEKEKLLKDFNDRINDTEGKLSSLEDENQRLISHIENMKNKYEKIVQEHKICEKDKQEQNNLLIELNNIRNEINYLRNENNNLRLENSNMKNEYNNVNTNIMNLQNENYNLKNDKLTYFSEGEKLLKENENLQNQYRILCDERNNLINLNNDFKRRLSQAEEECKEYERRINILNNDLGNVKESDMYFKELQRNFNKETRDKQNLALENENIKSELEIANKKIEIIENEKRAMKFKMGKGDGYVYKHAISEINKFKSFVDKITEKINRMQLSKDSLDFLKTINIRNKNVNNVIQSFKILYNKMKDRIEVLRREAHDLSKFNKNERVMEVLKKFAEEFKNAKFDLDSTKQYLEQKNREIKEIKKEKIGLEKKYNNLLQKMSRTACV